MSFERQTHSCLWSTPTMFLKWPYWLDSQEWPWSCVLEGQLRLLGSSETCSKCTSWTLRGAEDPAAEFSTTDKILKG